MSRTVKNLPAKRETQVQSLGREIPWRRKWQPTPVFLPGKSHGQRSLASYSPWGSKEWETLSLSLIYIYLNLSMILAFKDWFMYFFKTTWFLNMDQFFTWWSTEEKANFSMLEVKLSVELSETQYMWFCGGLKKCSIIIWDMHSFTCFIYWLSVQFSHSVMSDSLRPHGLQHARPPCPSATPRVYPNSCPLGQWCHPTISSSVITFSSHLQSFPALGPFQMSQFFSSEGQSIGVSASTSVLPINWFPLGWKGWISLQSKGLSRIFSNSIVQKHQFFGTQLSL